MPDFIIHNFFLSPVYMIYFKTRSPASGHFSEINNVCIYDMLCISFNAKLNEQSIFTLITAQYRLIRYFLVLTWLKYQNEKTAEYFY